jgi:hypothetical protein
MRADQIKCCHYKEERQMSLNVAVIYENRVYLATDKASYNIGTGEYFSSIKYKKINDTTYYAHVGSNEHSTAFYNNYIQGHIRPGPALSDLHTASKNMSMFYGNKVPENINSVIKVLICGINDVNKAFIYAIGPIEYVHIMGNGKAYVNADEDITKYIKNNMTVGINSFDRVFRKTAEMFPNIVSTAYDLILIS